MSNTPANYALLPELKKFKNWICWQLVADGAEVKKHPFNPATGWEAACNDPSTWVDFDDAKAAVESGQYQSVGFVLTDEVGLTIIDFDKVCAPGAPFPSWVTGEIEHLDSYTERSCSGRGAHVLVWGSVPTNHNRQKQHIEIWSRDKMFALSFDAVDGRDRIEKADEVTLLDLHKRIEEKRIGPPEQQQSSGGTRGIIATTNVDFGRLWNADANYIAARYGGDDSEADLGLVGALTHRTNGDREQMERLWLLSPLGQRDKTQGREDYRERTIDRALTDFEPKPNVAPKPDEAIIPKPFPTELTGRWFRNADEFLAQELPEREPLIFQDGTPLFLRKFICEVFAYRGVGKSLLVEWLVRLLLLGGSLMRFTSKGSYRVALIDAELPAEDLQQRLSTIGNTDGRLQIFSPEFTNGQFPKFQEPQYQDMLLEQLAEFQPDVVVFDSLSACFRADTNDPEHNNRINDLLLRLRFAGYCVIFVHHAGKNGTQRGRSDIEDHADLVIKLSALDDAEIGELRAKLEYEKKRARGVVHGFCFEFGGLGGFREIADDTTNNIALALLQKRTWKSIAKEQQVSSKTIARVQRSMRESPSLFTRVQEMHEQGETLANDLGDAFQHFPSVESGEALSGRYGGKRPPKAVSDGKQEHYA